MNRRSLLAASGGAFISTVAGCLDWIRTVPKGMEIETHHWVADILKEGIGYQWQEREESINRYHELIEDETAAENRIDGDGSVTEFVEETNFEKSYLLVVQNVMQSARWLELRRITRTDSGIDVAVNTASPDEPYGDDASIHSLAIRVTDEQMGIPDEIHVTVDGEPTET